MLYIFDKIDSVSDDFYESKISFLSEQRKVKVDRLRNNLNRNASCSVYLLLRLALSEIYNIDVAVDFAFGINGKPYLKDYPYIFFSLSHSHNIAACAVAGVEIGVDVQKIKPVDEKVAKRVLSEDEYIQFLHSPSPDEYFCEIWTKKESFLKKSGDGITKELREISADSLTGIKSFRGNDYYCTICGADMQVKHIRRDDFEHLYGR